MERFELAYAEMRGYALGHLAYVAPDIPPADRADLVDAAMLRLWVNWPKLEGEPAPRRFGWLRVTVQRCSIDWRRRWDQRHVSSGFRDEWDLPIPDADDTEELLARVRGHMAHLTVAQRQAVESYLAGTQVNSDREKARRKAAWRRLRRCMGITR